MAGLPWLLLGGSLASPSNHLVYPTLHGDFADTTFVGLHTELSLLIPSIISFVSQSH